MTAASAADIGFVVSGALLHKADGLAAAEAVASGLRQPASSWRAGGEA